MKLVTFMKESLPSLGVKVEEGIIDIASALSSQPMQHVPTEVMDVIYGGEETLSVLTDFISTLDISSDSPYMLNEKDLDWGPCVTNPSKIICIGLNYRRHADETNAPYPESPILFNKFNNTLTGNLCDIAVPRETNQLDYEVELGIVIGKSAKYISKESALDHVFGYYTANDLSARDLQFKTNQWLLGKTCDGFSPLGPYLVSADEVGNPNNLSLKTIVNGEVRQDSNTSDMIFYCDEIISYISQYMTLSPGDVILTGTPEGVVLGLPEEERVYLQPGDEVTVEIEKLGKLTNAFVAE
ncbi:fumarylacetoacetate hydrolase family protein [Aquibacillus sp. 3ASR75-11]|uniref:Fumarylacetoacetate hydrolase family protein n=1 Tax=Terrihalobacillus insolitus TaxID=2950438 RepID=A0A9X3WSE7_9BACI|nr:fumarylacetoacetate hydrolase family protein [Terrihalobacillus insolitus]MDC3423411.1 fumarylacetoacetate hydrolase family protein [Terrihalobacillus insolitus]